MRSASWDSRERPLERSAAVGRPRPRAEARPGASAMLEMTRPISTPGRRPERMDSAIARKLEPRPERRTPRRVGRESDW